MTYYAAALGAVQYVDEIVNLGQTVAVVRAESDAQADSAAMASAFELFPSADGWSDHHVTAQRIADAVMEMVGATDVSAKSMAPAPEEGAEWLPIA